MKLNIEVINQLADVIEQCEEVEQRLHKWGMVGPAFNMQKAHYRCGAPACLIGHNASMHGRTRTALFGNLEIADDLGITEKQADELTAPQHDYADYYVNPGSQGFITKDHAAAVLRHLADEGVVDWSIFEPHGETNAEKN